MYRKFMIKDSWDRKKLSRPNMDYGSPEIRTEGVKENVWKVQD